MRSLCLKDFIRLTENCEWRLEKQISSFSRKPSWLSIYDVDKKEFDVRSVPKFEGFVENTFSFQGEEIVCKNEMVFYENFPESLRLKEPLSKRVCHFNGISIVDDVTGSELSNEDVSKHIGKKFKEVFSGVIFDYKENALQSGCDGEYLLFRDVAGPLKFKGDLLFSKEGPTPCKLWGENAYVRLSVYRTKAGLYVCYYEQFDSADSKHPVFCDGTSCDFLQEIPTFFGGSPVARDLYADVLIELSKDF